MHFPALHDTIVAVSSGWQASPLSIVRLSGPQARQLVATLGVPPPASEAEVIGRPAITGGVVRVDDDLEFSGTAYWFAGQRSYTGQDLVELHVAGCLPLLRALCARLIELGARPALPGEFTARAYLAGKLRVDQVEDVLATISADRGSAERQQRRARRSELERRRAGIRERLAGLLALVEAGIDFAEEEDVRLLSGEELRRALEALALEAAECGSAPVAASCLVRPHVAIIGLPNAGKSTLFNAMLGYERAIVSPVLGTTRDVLSAEVVLDRVEVVLQDCAGLGRTADELELAAHLAAERSAAQADLIIWVQACDVPWDDQAARVLDEIPQGRWVLVLSKSDLEGGSHPAAGVPGGFPKAVSVSAVTGEGLEELRREIADRVSRIPVAPPVSETGFRAAAAAIQRALDLCGSSAGSGVDCAELVSVELRSAYDELAESAHGEVVEDLLGRLFSEFCVGK
jgi:tRNA modification GTPase